MEAKRYWTQFDGIRGLAISAVVAYHLGYLPGGWLGVDVFFVLSGYLITDILVSRGGPKGRLKEFWSRRARRLLPAVFLLLIVLSIYAWVGGPGLVPAQLRAPGLATLLYVANWQEIISGHGYFAAFTAPSPLQHTWSLAIEEQYYIFWPLLLAGMLALSHAKRFRIHRHALVITTLILAASSAVWMGIAAHHFDPNRAYLGTDTRAWELLLGGAAAMMWPPGSPAKRTRPWSVFGILGFAGVVLGVWRAGGPPWWVWNGGLVVIAVCATLVVLASIKAPDSLLAKCLSLGPLRWLGLISYSLYLWHWPAIVLMTPATTGLTGSGLLCARLAAMFAASCASYYVVEGPLRRADWSGWARRLHVPAASFAGAGIVLVSLIIVVGTIGPPTARSGQVQIAAPSKQSQALTPTLALPPANPANPYRVWLFGDSVMQDASLGIQAALEATGESTVVQNSTAPGWGLTTDRQWPSEAQQIMASNHPQIAIATWSWDTGAVQSDPAAYQAQLKQAIQTMLDGGVQLVILLQFPQVGPVNTIGDPATQQAVWAQRVSSLSAWDEQARLAAASFPGHALYMPINELLAPGGRFYTWFKLPTGGWLRARKLDNTHFCPYGAASLGALITSNLTVPLKLAPMKPGWDVAAWTSDPRYNDPPGACPADQPPPGYNGVKVP